MLRVLAQVGVVVQSVNVLILSLLQVLVIVNTSLATPAVLSEAFGSHQGRKENPWGLENSGLVGVCHRTSLPALTEADLLFARCVQVTFVYHIEVSMTSKDTWTAPFINVS